MYRSNTLNSYHSEDGISHGSLRFENESTSQINRLADGTLEITDTLPKKEYYMSLRKNGSLGGSMNRIGAGSNSNFNTLNGTLRSGFLEAKSQNHIDYKPSGKMMECVILMLDGTEEVISFDRECFGQHLFIMVSEHLELKEREYFGIIYKDKRKVSYWLEFGKKITKQVSASRPIFEFQVKYYPPNAYMMVEELTRYYFSLQVRQDIITGVLPCSFNIYVLLGAYVIQSEAGDFDPENHRGLGYLRNQQLAPQSIQNDDMLSRISELHKQHRGLSPEDADRMFIDNARRLALYGVDQHKVTNSEREELILGVNHSGILLYRQKIRIIHFSWARLTKVSYKNKKVILSVRGVTKSDPKRDLIFKCANTKLAKRLYNAVVDHHYFFRMIELNIPKKPNLQPGFATRKYYKQPPQTGSSNGDGDFTYDKGSAHKINRGSTKRNEQTDPGWNNTLPNKDGSFREKGVNTMSPLVGHQLSHVNSQGPKKHKNNADIEHRLLISQDDIRPLLPPLHWRMSPADCTLTIGMDEKGLDIASQPNTGWQGCRTNKGVKAPGEFFYEAHILEDGLVRLGWATNDASLSLGTDVKGFGYGADEAGNGWDSDSKGRYLHDNRSQEYGLSVFMGDYVGCRVNLSNGEMAWYKNGTPMHVASKIPEQLRREPVFPTLSVKDGRVEFNFGDSAFVYPPSDSETWVPVCQAGETNQVPNKHIGWRLNAYEATTGMDLSADGLMAQSAWNQGWQGTKCNKGVKGRGKYYYEATSMENGGLARVGWGTDFASLDLGTDNLGFGYGADIDGYGLTGNQGKKMFKNDIENYGRAICKGDTVGCLLNLNEGKMQWSLNGEIYGVAYDIPLELRNGPLAFFPTVSLKDNTMDMNFGEKGFKYYPGSEWTPLTYTQEAFMKSSRKKGPERKVKGLSYMNLDYTDNSDERNTPSHSDISIRVPSSFATSPEVPDENIYEPQLCNKTGSRTVTNGEVTEVATNEPCVESETYYDEHGNLVKRTVTKTKRVTKTTKRTSELVTERSENDVATVRTDRVRRVKMNDDFDEDELRKAILSVTYLDDDAAVLNDFVGSVGIAAKSKSKSAIESEL